MRSKLLLIGIGLSVTSVLGQVWLLLRALISESTYGITKDAWMSYWPLAIVLVPGYCIIVFAAFFSGRLATALTLLLSGVLCNSYLYLTPGYSVSFVNVLLASIGTSILIYYKARHTPMRS